MTDIAPGYTAANGKRAPNKSWGTTVYVQLRCGTLPKEPWPVSTTRWIHDGTDGDVIAIRKVEN